MALSLRRTDQPFALASLEQLVNALDELDVRHQKFMPR